MKYACIFVSDNNTKRKKTMKTTIKSELKRRMDLVNDINFREICAKHSELIGITPKEWNENKAIIIMKFANDFCGIENKELRNA